MAIAARWRLISFALIAVGLVVSGYLLARTFELTSQRAADTVDICSTVFGASCDETLKDRSFWKLGIPLAGWGVVFYGTIACLLVMAWALGRSFDQEATLAALLLATIGAGVSVVLAGIMLFGSVAICPFCLIVQALNLALVPAIKSLSGRSVRQLGSSLAAGLKYTVGRPAAAPDQAPWKVVGLLTAALVATALFQWVSIRAERSLASANDLQFMVEQFELTPRQEIPVDSTAPRIGPTNAPARLVVFSSFHCPGCRSFVNIMKSIARQFPDSLTIVFKHFPLGTDCNNTLQVDMQPLACAAARAAEAAHQQGRFWPFHDSLFNSNLQEEEGDFQRIGREIGLDLARFDADRKTESASAKVRADVALGSRLGVDATPTVFLNGKRVEQVSRQVLSILIQREKSATSH